MEHILDCLGSMSMAKQRAKKIVSNSLGLVDYAIRLVNSVFNLPNGQKNCEINSARQKAYGAG